MCVCFQTALHWAARHGREDAVDMMLHSGADVNVRSVSVFGVCAVLRTDVVVVYKLHIED